MTESELASLDWLAHRASNRCGASAGQTTAP